MTEDIIPKGRAKRCAQWDEHGACRISYHPQYQWKVFCMATVKPINDAANWDTTALQQAKETT